MAHKPRVLVLGGLNVCSPALLNFLVPNNQDPLVSAVRVVDKFSVRPPTTYLGSRVRKTLENPIVEYRQANLTNPATVASVFEPPEGQPPWDYVFDFTGEIRFDRSDEIHLAQTTKLVRGLGLEAAKRKVRAYVRCGHAFYITSLDKSISSESDPVPPGSVRGYWWHEASRALAAIPDLNLVIFRCAATYGPQQIFGTVASRIVIGRVYQHTEAEMKYLWPLRYNTVHSEDIAAAMFHAANWIAGIGRAEANRLAGEVFPHFPSKERSAEKQADALLSVTTKPVAPYFNMVDDTDTTLKITGEIIAEVFGIKFSFYATHSNTTASSVSPWNDSRINQRTVPESDDWVDEWDFESMVEDINEEHMTPWTEIIQTSNPPVPNTPLTAFIDAHKLAKYSIAYSNQKIKRVLGYTFRHPKFTAEEVRAVIDSFREEGTWPN